MRSLWSDEELAIARQMRADRKKWPEIAAAIGRTPRAVKHKLTEEACPSYVPHATIPIEIPPIVLADRARRLSAPWRSFSHYITGCPRYGYSALDGARAS